LRGHSFSRAALYTFESAPSARLRNRCQLEFRARANRFGNDGSDRVARHQHAAFRLVDPARDAVEVELRVTDKQCIAVQFLQLNLVSAQNIPRRLQLSISAFCQPQHACLLEQSFVSSCSE
jgi:hypothetical protein